LAQKYKCSAKTIQRKLDSFQINIKEKEPRKVVVLMDTTYVGNIGIMLFKDSISKENLLKFYVKSETNVLYKKGIEELNSKGFTILGIVCDGRRGLIKSFPNVPVQMCQFHQVAIIRRYLTKNPRMPAAKELMDTVRLLKQTDKESFEGALKLWHLKWDWFLNERTIDETTGKSYYTHRRLRSAIRSLETNLPWLFTWYDNMDLKIPNTNNSLEGYFANLKNKLRNHNGLSKQRKMKFIDGFLKV